MKSRIFILILLIVVFKQVGFCFPHNADEPKTLAIGSAAPDFSLKGTDNKTYTLGSFIKNKILVIILFLFCRQQ